jgi:hypothetical protein
MAEYGMHADNSSSKPRDGSSNLFHLDMSQYPSGRRVWDVWCHDRPVWVGSDKPTITRWSITVEVRRRFESCLTHTFPFQCSDIIPLNCERESKIAISRSPLCGRTQTCWSVQHPNPARGIMGCDSWNETTGIIVKEI